MAKYTGPACRLCRREGEKLFGKGDRCFTSKCAIARRGEQKTPGQHGAARKKISEYGLQLREKQKAKRYYGIQEKQFANYFKKADAKEGMTGENLLTLIERRLDNVVYRMGMGESRRDARQLVVHGHFLVNGRKVNIPSYLVKEGDVISLKEKSRSLPKVKAVLEQTEGKVVPKWLDLDTNTMQAKVVALAQRDDIDIEIEEHLIVELYSK